MAQNLIEWYQVEELVNTDHSTTLYEVGRSKKMDRMYCKDCAYLVEGDDGEWICDNECLPIEDVETCCAEAEDEPDYEDDMDKYKRDIEYYKFTLYAEDAVEAVDDDDCPLVTAEERVYEAYSVFGDILYEAEDGKITWEEALEQMRAEFIGE